MAAPLATGRAKGLRHAARLGGRGPRSGISTLAQQHSKQQQRQLMARSRARVPEERAVHGERHEWMHLGGRRGVGVCVSACACERERERERGREHLQAGGVSGTHSCTRPAEPASSSASGPSSCQCTVLYCSRSSVRASECSSVPGRCATASVSLSLFCPTCLLAAACKSSPNQRQ